jgi:hypothetical protein
VPPQDDSASIAAALTGIVTPGNHLVGDGGKPLAAFARKARIPFHAAPAPGKPSWHRPPAQTTLPARSPNAPDRIPQSRRCKVREGVLMGANM